QLVSLDSLREIASNSVVIVSRDIELLAFAGALPPLECLFDILSGQFIFTDIGVCCSQRGVGQRKIGIQLNGMLEEWDGFQVFSPDMQVPGYGVRLQRFQRWRGSLLYWSIVFLHRG